MKKTIALTAALSILGAVALAGPSKKDAKKVTDVWTCPMTGEKTTAATQNGAPVLVGKYRLHFCCAGCPSAFAKLSPKDKAEKAASAAKKDVAKKG